MPPPIIGGLGPPIMPPGCIPMQLQVLQPHVPRLQPYVPQVGTLLAAAADTESPSSCPAGAGATVMADLMDEACAVVRVELSPPILRKCSERVRIGLSK